MRRIVVTGMGAITPVGNSVPAFWNALLSGKSGAAPITRFDTRNYKTTFACEVKNFNPAGLMPRQDLRKYDLFTQYALAAADEAVKQADIDLSGMNKVRAGVIWGAGDGGVSTFEEQFETFLNG